VVSGQFFLFLLFWFLNFFPTPILHLTCPTQHPHTGNEDTHINTDAHAPLPKPSAVRAAVVPCTHTRHTDTHTAHRQNRLISKNVRPAYT
jgi:hypothetical protein